MKKAIGVIMGVLLIAAGVVFALENLGIAKIDISFDGWWTVFIIVPSISGLFSGKDKTGNIIALAIGIYLLLAARGIIEYAILWKLFVPAVIVFIGVKIILKNLTGDDRENAYKNKNEN